MSPARNYPEETFFPPGLDKSAAKKSLKSKKKRISKKNRSKSTGSSPSGSDEDVILITEVSVKSGNSDQCGSDEDVISILEESEASVDIDSTEIQEEQLSDGHDDEAYSYTKLSMDQASEDSKIETKNTSIQDENKVTIETVGSECSNTEKEQEERSTEAVITSKKTQYSIFDISISEDSEDAANADSTENQEEQLSDGHDNDEIVKEPSDNVEDVSRQHIVQDSGDVNIHTNENQLSDDPDNDGGDDIMESQDSEKSTTHEQIQDEDVNPADMEAVGSDNEYERQENYLCSVHDILLV